jgi:phosphate acetyltransferase
MDLLDRLLDNARRRNRKIVLPEGDDARIVAAAARLKADKLARPILLGAADAIGKIASRKKSTGRDRHCRPAQRCAP